MVDTVVANVAGTEASHSAHRQAADTDATANFTDMANANAVYINIAAKLSYMANVDTTNVGAPAESSHVASAAKATAADRRPRGRVGPTRNGEARGHTLAMTSGDMMVCAGGIHRRGTGRST
jgi:hypothetical protein